MKIKSDQLITYDDEQLQRYTPIPLPVPLPPIAYGSDLVPLCVSRQYLTYIVTALQIYAQKDAWLGTLEEQKWAKGQIFKLWTSIARLENCDTTMFDLRQNPSDDCEIQKSLDGGLTWVTAWRLDLCIPEDITSVRYSLTGRDYNDFLRDTLDSYDGTVESVFPDTVYQADGFNGDRDIALCWALRAIVDEICIAAIEYITDLTLFLNVVKAGLILAGGILSVPTFGVSAIVFTGIAIATGAIDTFNSMTLAAAELYEDLDARATVACAMFEKLHNETISNVRWLTAVDDFTPAGIAEPAIKLAVSRFLTDENIYINFLNLMNKGMALAKVGLIDLCDCVEWTVERLGGDGNANMSVVVVDGALGTYNAIDDRYEGSPNAGKVHLLVLMESPMFPFFVTSVSAELHIDNTAAPNTSNYIAATNGEGTVGTVLTLGSNYVDGDHTLGVNDVDAQKLGLAFRLEAQGTGGHAWLKKITITGRGFNPFE